MPPAARQEPIRNKEIKLKGDDESKIGEDDCIAEQWVRGQAGEKPLAGGKPVIACNAPDENAMDQAEHAIVKTKEAGIEKRWQNLPRPLVDPGNQHLKKGEDAHNDVLRPVDEQQEQRAPAEQRDACYRQEVDRQQGYGSLHHSAQKISVHFRRPALKNGFSGVAHVEKPNKIRANR